MNEAELIAQVRERDKLVEEVCKRIAFGDWEEADEVMRKLDSFDEENKLPIKKMDNWAVVDLPLTPYDAPGTKRQALVGDWYFNGTHASNTVTSIIVGVIGKYHVKTVSGSIYETQRVDPEWLKTFPLGDRCFFQSTPQL